MPEQLRVLDLFSGIPSAASASASSEPECEPSHSAKLTPIADEFSPSIGQLSLFTTTCEPLVGLIATPTTKMNMAAPSMMKQGTGCRNLAALMSSAVAFPARTSVLPERAQALTASAAGYGRNTPELLARYDPATSSWRTSQLCLDGALAEFSETWPRSGTMRNGIAYQLPPLVRLTDETASGLWQTPVSDDAVERTRGKFNSRGEPKLSAEVKWRTPQARDGDARGQQSPEKRMAGGHSVSLAEQVKWPTPDANCWKGGGDNQRRGQLNGSLNPTWVEWLMGFPLGWTALEPSATPSSRKSRKSSAGQS